MLDSTFTIKLLQFQWITKRRVINHFYVHQDEQDDLLTGF